MGDSDFNRIKLPPSVKSSILADLSNNFANTDSSTANIDADSSLTQQAEEESRGRATKSTDRHNRPILRNAGVATAPIIPTLKADDTKGSSTADEVDSDHLSPLNSHESGALQAEPRPAMMHRLASMVEESDCDSDCDADAEKKKGQLYCKKHKKVHTVRRMGERLKRTLSKEPSHGSP